MWDITLSPKVPTLARGSQMECPCFMQAVHLQFLNKSITTQKHRSIYNARFIYNIGVWQYEYLGEVMKNVKQW